MITAVGTVITAETDVKVQELGPLISTSESESAEPLTTGKNLDPCLAVVRSTVPRTQIVITENLSHWTHSTLMTPLTLLAVILGILNWLIQGSTILHADNSWGGE